jgi:hypothetical protein
MQARPPKKRWLSAPHDDKEVFFTMDDRLICSIMSLAFLEAVWEIASNHALN